MYYICIKQKQMETVQVEFRNVELTIEYHYTPEEGEDYLTPPYPENIDIENVLIEDTNVNDLIENYISELEHLIIDKFYR